MHRPGGIVRRRDVDDTERRGLQQPGETDRFGERGRPQHVHTRGSLGCGCRQHRPAEPEPRRLGQTARGLVDLAQLSTKAHLTAGDEVSRKRDVELRRRECERQGQISAGLEDADTTDSDRVDVELAQSQAEALLQHG